MKDNIEIARSPAADLKSIKNETEIEGNVLHSSPICHVYLTSGMNDLWVYIGFRQSHIRDGAALARYFAWLEEQLDNGVELNESQAADQLEKYRS